MKKLFGFTSFFLALVTVFWISSPEQVAQAQLSAGHDLCEYNVACPAEALHELGIKNQNGQIVGYVHVPVRAQKDCTYAEYWYLLSNYRYPGTQAGVSISIGMSDYPRSPDAETFKTKMKQQFPGGKLVIVLAQETSDCGPNLPADL